MDSVLWWIPFFLLPPLMDSHVNEGEAWVTQGLISCLIAPRFLMELSVSWQVFNLVSWWRLMTQLEIQIEPQREAFLNMSASLKSVSLSVSLLDNEQELEWTQERVRCLTAGDGNKRTYRTLSGNVPSTLSSCQGWVFINCPLVLISLTRQLSFNLICHQFHSSCQVHLEWHWMTPNGNFPLIHLAMW